jgi:serine phosphatase RsbU (regulator of sigma subunit)
VRLDPGETLLLYTDGVLETRNSSGSEYGIERLCALSPVMTALPPKEVVSACLDDLTAFRGEIASTDDLTIMAVRRQAAAARGHDEFER